MIVLESRYSATYIAVMLWIGIGIMAGCAAAIVVAFRSTGSRFMSISKQLGDIKAALAEASTEITAKIASLEESLANAVTAEDQKLLDEIRSAAEDLADIVPNDVVAEDVPAAGDTFTSPKFTKPESAPKQSK